MLGEVRCAVWRRWWLKWWLCLMKPGTETREVHDQQFESQAGLRLLRIGVSSMYSRQDRGISCSAERGSEGTGP